MSLLILISPLSFSDAASTAATKEISAQKCDEYSKTYEELSLELRTRDVEGIVNDRNEYLEREIPRVKGLMEKYCDKSR